MTAASKTDAPRVLPDLSPAKWIWYPSTRCLPNTFVLFRKEIQLNARPKRATGWISADSRYLLRVNDRRVQWGPAPCDPRWFEADPMDLTDLLDEGVNVLAVQALYFGYGDGTSPMGNPGLLFRLDIEMPDGTTHTIVSDDSWKACIPRCWKPGQHKRSYLRALQEDFDARYYPNRWASTPFEPTADWTNAMVINCPADKPPICAHYENYMYGFHAETALCEMRQRTIPHLREYPVPAHRLNESYWLRWKRPPDEYFEVAMQNAFEVDPEPSASDAGAAGWHVELDGKRTACLLFELKDQVVGWPFFTIEAPEGTVVELLVHEAHKPVKSGGPAIMNSHWHSWTRFTCKEGANTFETFDYESCRWVQLLIRNTTGRVVVRDVGVRRRIYPWPNEPVVACSEPALQRLFDASINTLHNCAQDVIVDGMARERQQYSGDCGHQMHAIYFTFGETTQPARYLTTWSQGLTVDGYFMDCWPAFDRVARVMSRALQLSAWGPILDHGIGFNFDCWHHYLYTSDREAIAEPFPRLVRFVEYLKSIQADNGLMPVEDLGIPMVWIDHQGYEQQRHKQCAFNLYAAAMLKHAHAPICRLFGEESKAKAAEAFSDELLAACIKHFWSDKRNCFVNNLPWSRDDGKQRLCDRSLATAVLFDQCPDGQTDEAIRLMAEMPDEVGGSYPANAGWRLWALAKAGRTDVVLKDLRERWATMDSVHLNNTLQEDWTTTPDSGYQWSHCAVVPLYITFMSIAGIQPIEPGFTRCRIRPQLADLHKLNLAAHTVRGPILFSSQGELGGRDVHITLPTGCEGELVTHKEEMLELEQIRKDTKFAYYQLPAGRKSILRLRYS